MSASSQFLRGLEIRRCLFMAGHTVLTYDYLLTLDLEIEYIWRAPRSIVKVLFLFNRYGTLIGHSFLTLEEVGILSHGSRKFCITFLWFQGLLVLLSSETVRTLLLLRAWALWRCSYRIAVSLVSVYVFYVVVLSGYASYIMFKFNRDFYFPYLEETGVCVVYDSVAIAWLLGLISFLLDTCLFAVVAYYLYKLCRGSIQLQHSALLRLLVRDALLFYVANVFHDVLTTLTLSVWENNPFNLVQAAFSFPLLVVAGQRVVLNLRGFQSKAYSTHEISRAVNRQIADMQGRSFWKSVDLWMNDLHQEMELKEEASRYRTLETMGSRGTDEAIPYELEVIHRPVGSRHCDVQA